MSALSRPLKAALVLVLGVGVLASVGSPAVAASSHHQRQHRSHARPHAMTKVRTLTKVLSRPMHGRAAVTALGAHLADVASLNGRTTKQLSSLLADDPTMWIAPTGRLFVKEEPAPGASSATGAGALAGATASAPLDQTFALHSLPGSHHTLYLDFDGVDLGFANQWTSQGVTETHHAGWDPMDDGPAFDDRERTAIQEIWARVAEDYAPFDVDVTTADPGEDALTRSSYADQDFGTRLVVTDDDIAWQQLCSQQCGGIAWVGTFGVPENDSQYQDAWVFSSGVSDFPRYVAEAAAHEIGHTLGLTHDGTTAQGDGSYDSGHAMWAPIMGAGYDHGVTQWSKGDYFDANNQQDDTAVIANVAGRRADDVGDTPATAARRQGGTHYIGTRSDVDYYSLGQCDGAVTVSAEPAATGPDLDLGLTVVDDQGATVASAAPATTETTTAQPWPWIDNATSQQPTISGLDAAVTTSLPTGHYYVVVDGAGAEEGGASDVWADYDDYGSLGAYTLSTSGCVQDTVVPQAPTAVTSTLSGANGFTVSWAAPADDGGSEVTGYDVSIDGGEPTFVGPEVTTYAWPGVTTGTHTASVSAVNAQGAGAAATSTDRRDLPGVPRLVKTFVATNPNGYDPTLQYFNTMWEPALDNGNRPTLSYDFEYEFTPGNWERLDPFTADPNEATNIWTHYTEGIDLTPGWPPTNIRVRAVNEVGAGDWLTLQGHIDGPPMYPAAGDVTFTVDKLAHTVQVDWTDPYDGGQPIQGTRLALSEPNPQDPQHPIVTEMHDLAPGTHTFTFHDVPAGDHIIGVDTYNQLGGNGFRQVVTVPALLPPDAVTQFAPVVSGYDRSQGMGSATVSWTAPSTDPQLPILGYDVVVDDAAPVRVAADVTSYTLDGLALGSTHTVKVAAVNLAGAGDLNGPAEISIVTTPTAVTDLRATVDRRDPTNLAVSATWTESSDNGGDWMHQSYFWRLQPVGGPDAAWQTAYSSPALQAWGVQPGAYTLEVKAQNQQGDSPTTSVPVTVALPDAPGAVSNFRARMFLSDSSVYVSWDAPADGGSPVTGYRMTLTDQTTGDVSEPVTFLEAGRMLTGVTNGDSYSVEVTPQNVRGDGTAAAWTFVAADHAPDPVTGLKAVADPVARTVTVGWESPAWDGGAPIQSYSVRLDKGDWYDVDPDTLSFTFPAVDNGSHTVQVRATNGAIDDGGQLLVSIASGTVTMLDHATAPSAPKIGTARPGARGGALTAVFAWSAPADTGGAAITGYEVDVLSLKHGKQVAKKAYTAKAAATSLQVRLKRKSGITYAAVVKARNSEGRSPASARSKAVAPR